MLETRREGSFLIRILDQQHSSWQGTITWVAENDKKTFRSLLELINLISAELARNGGDREDDMDDGDRVLTMSPPTVTVMGRGAVNCG